MTARWAVDKVKPQRALEITWQPISLLFKNEPEEDSDYYAPSAHTHSLLRVMESLRKTEGNEAVEKFYWAAGSAIHHDDNTYASASDLLNAAGLNVSHASAAKDESFDAEIRSSMERAFELVGEDVGTPIIEFPTTGAIGTETGNTVGIFGPVISEMPSDEESLVLWDAMTTLATMDGFWELKRTRTTGPNFPDRPT